MSVAQYWQTLRPIRKVGKSRGVIEVPAFSAACGPSNNSLLFAAYPSQGRSINILSLAANPDMTIFFNIKPLTANVAGSELVSRYTAVGPATPAFTAKLFPDGTVTLTVVTTVDTYTITCNNALAFNEWNYLGIVISDTSSYAAVYVDGVLQGLVDIDGDVITGADDSIVFCGPALAATLSTYISRITIWDTELTANKVASKYNRLISDDPAVEANLIVMFKLQEGTGTATDSVNGLTITVPLSSRITWADGEYAPVYIGCSFIAGQFAVEASSDFSLKFPNAAPDDCNFGLVIRWIDDDDNVKRYYLFLPEVGELDVNPFPEQYRGQKIPSTGAVLEVWNVDGNATVDLESVYTLYTSILHNATSYTTPTTTEDATLTIDTTLAQDLPLTPFPLTFATQQTY